MYAAPGAASFSEEARLAMGVQLPPPKNWKVLLGMAVLVAEQIADGLYDVNEIATEMHEAITRDEASKTDIDLIGDEWGFDDVETVVKLLLKLWPMVQMQASALINRQS
jgi:hypothetical protein